MNAELQLAKQRTEGARKVAALNQSRAEEAEREDFNLTHTIYTEQY